MPKLSDVLLLGWLGLLVLAVLAGFRPLVTYGVSMEPTIREGTVLFTYPVRAVDLELGEFAVVEHPDGRLVSHRVVSSVPLPDGSARLVMRGDNNPSDDAPLVLAEARRIAFWLPLGDVVSHSGTWVLLGSVFLFRRLRR